MRRIRKILLIAVALLFLLTEEIWLRLRQIVEWVIDALPLARFKLACRRFLEWLPAYPTLFLFLVPLVATEPLKFFSYWLLHKHQWVAGTGLYFGVDILRLGLVSFVFGVSRDKLLSIGWFRVLYTWFVCVHDWAFGLVAPYKAMIKAAALQLKARLFSGRSRVSMVMARLRRKPRAL